MTAEFVDCPICGTKFDFNMKDFHVYRHMELKFNELLEKLEEIRQQAAKNPKRPVSPKRRMSPKRR